MLAFLTQRWFLCALITGVGLALLAPHAVHAATQHLAPPLVIAVALFLMAWTMPSRSLAGELRQPWAALWATAIGYGALPAMGWLVGHVAPLPDVQIGLLLAASVPCTLASCVLWTRLAGGNEATALLTVLFCTLSSWFLTTFWLAATTGAQVDIPISKMMRELVITLVVPVAVGQGLRFYQPCAEFANRHKRALGVVAQLFVLSIVLKAAAAVGLQVEEGGATLTPTVLIGSAVLALGLHLAALYAGLWSSAGWGFDRPRQIAVAFSGSQKTLPVSLFLFQEYFQEDYPLAVVPLLFFHVGQLLLDTLIAERLKRQALPVEVVDAL
jgi:solute carrier family 10 (sodium/bile acid cotransporter), member 7